MVEDRVSVLWWLLKILDCWKKVQDLGLFHFWVDFFFSISHCSLVANHVLGLLCKLDIFGAVRITGGHLFFVEGGMFPHWGSPALVRKFNFLVMHDTLPAFRSNGQVLLHDPQQAHGLLLPKFPTPGVQPPLVAAGSIMVFVVVLQKMTVRIGSLAAD